ncbi:MAG: hypothetical protein IJ055_04045 [Oscillospiraceae bacterium]|nr:hypothetical protein [Oscillospiraceae bacterium]
MSLTSAQLRAVRWYIGDVTGDDPFWGDPKAYTLFNALFFPGIDTERRRAAEGKRLNPALLEDQGRLLQTMRALRSAFSPAEAPLVTFRVERLADWQVLETAGRTVSPTSTSLGGFLESYRDRRGIALVQFTIPPGTPCLPMAQVLPRYAKPEEAEVLLPPRVALTIERRALTDDERRILDADGAPPALAAQALCIGEAQDPVCAPPLLQEDADAGVRVVKALGAGREPDPMDVEGYLRWKAAFGMLW